MARTPPSLSLLLCAIFVFASRVLAVSAVLGIDLGTEYIKAALVKPGIPLEIVLTKDSRRKETSAVAFKPSHNGPKQGSYPERVYGADAMALAPRFPGDVFPNLKPLLGLPMDSAEVKEYAKRHPALQLQAHKLRGTAAFKSAGAFSPEEEAWLVEELLAMELASIRSNAEEMAKGPVRSAVLTVPPFYTIEEKRATEVAAELAGFKVLGLISDGLAVGLHYATSRQFPNINEGGKPEYHMVFDMGAGYTKATVLKFQSRTVKDVGKFNKTVQEVFVLGSGWDRSLGGDALNYLIVDDMIAKFVDSPSAKQAGVSADDVRAHGRTIAKLTKDAERVRHILSANQDASASFEGLYNDVDFRYTITRSTFEEMAAGHAERVGIAVQNAITAAGVELKDLDSVILHGGASRTPFVQKELQKVIGGADKIRTNVNSDEAAVFGAGFRAAELSPSFRVKEIRVHDVATYPAGMKWQTDDGKPKQQILWQASSHLGAPAKEVTFKKREDFKVTFYQVVPALASDAGTVEAETKVLSTTNLTATVAELVDKHKCNKDDVRVKVGARLTSENGEVDVTKVTVECEVEIAEKEGFVDGVKNLFGFGKKDKDQQVMKDDASSSSDSESSLTSGSSASSTTSTSSSPSSSETAATASADAGSSSKKKELVVIPIKFTLEKAGVPYLPKADLATLKDRLKAFDASDKARRQREEALNQLEPYTYKVRDLIEKEDFITHSTAEERAKLEKMVSETSDWLYGDGADAAKEVLKARLKDLKAIVEPVERRIDEAAKRPELIKGLQEALNGTKTFLADIKKQIADYEAFQAAKAAAESAASSGPDSASSTSTGTDILSTTPAPSATPTGEFDGLEDNASSVSAAKSSVHPVQANMEYLAKQRGPVPPLYTLEDLKETEELQAQISKWLEEKLAQQEKLGPTDDPVLLVKDLTDRREKLDKAGVELAMKAVRNYEKKKEGEKKGRRRARRRTGRNRRARRATVKFEEGKVPTQEEIDDMLKEFLKEAEETKKAEQQQQQQQQKEEEEEKKGHDEL
ncbi:heat shock protein 70-like protein [Thermochaetoides thermophila DSM 1495]|uniref:Heat shock protein 70-like protein n=1 Tax=Chaetomium thermophilum (strain DSM 1495 / CBS 144.50 / IMI 039719) TaxID=759272 RepID=G0S1X9_CHATD|nr:heat shock protein 70-like protein [Thermochaetoides thermophila DSM 1495]EGS23039.1 heat shock protein 70-like protein [Thermochaetoides thermophila DSM 1495]